MCGPRQQWRPVAILVTALVTTGVTTPSAQGPALPSANVLLFGGSGNDRGQAVSVHGGAVYVAATNQTSQTGSLLRFDLPFPVPTEEPIFAPAWSQTFEVDSPLLGISATSAGLRVAWAAGWQAAESRPV